MTYFIYGVPGVGKTSYSKTLGTSLGLKVVEADLLKKQAGIKDATCKAYKHFGSFNKANAIKGLLMVRDQTKVVIQEFLDHHDNFILEAAFLDPTWLRNCGSLVLLTCSDEELHKKRFLSHREKILDFRSMEFKAARLIQQFLIDEANKLEIPIVEA